MKSNKQINEISYTDDQPIRRPRHRRTNRGSTRNNVLDLQTAERIYSKDGLITCIECNCLIQVKNAEHHSAIYHTTKRSFSHPRSTWIGLSNAYATTNIISHLTTHWAWIDECFGGIDRMFVQSHLFKRWVHLLINSQTIYDIDLETALEDRIGYSVPDDIVENRQFYIKEGIKIAISTGYIQTKHIKHPDIDISISRVLDALRFYPADVSEIRSVIDTFTTKEKQLCKRVKIYNNIADYNMTDQDIITMFKSDDKCRLYNPCMICAELIKCNEHQQHMEIHHKDLGLQLCDCCGCYVYKGNKNIHTRHIANRSPVLSGYESV
jgi:hypothetical protein